MMNNGIGKDIERVLIDAPAIKERLKELGAEIASDYAGKALLMVGILRGAAVFYADLARLIPLPLHMNFMAVSSYGQSTESTGAVRIYYDLNEDIKGRGRADH